jgi:heptaprenyl diphosphate synthase
MRTHRLTNLAILLAISIVLSIVESMLPVIPIPGVKFGLANVVTLFIMYFYNDKDALIILLLRIILVGLLRGNIFSVTFYLSLSGGLNAYLFMVVVKKIHVFSIISVSIMGSLGHGIGQIMMAIFLIERNELIYYLPYIMVLSIITGTITGLITRKSLQIIKTVDS